MTKYSNLIIELINHSDAHMTAEQIFLQLKKSEPKVVLATVYNNLNALSQKGLIRKLSIADSPDRYDKITRHDHLICQKCGEISDINFGDFTGELNRQLDEEIISYDLKAFYICLNCKEKGGKIHEI